MTQTMMTSFPDVLNNGESVQQFVEVAATGRGTTMRARACVTPIATRFLHRHQSVMFELQVARRQPIDDDAVTGVFP